MTADATGRRIVAALANVEGPTRVRLAQLWAEYADHLAGVGEANVARVFLELGHAAAAGTSDADELAANFAAIVANLPAEPLDPTTN